MKIFLTILLLTPSLSWGDHKTSDDLTNKGLVCEDDKILYFTKYQKNIFDDSYLGSDFWLEHFDLFKVKKNQNIAIMYDPRNNGELFLRYQTDLTSIVLLNVRHYIGIFKHLNKEIISLQPNTYYGFIDRQELEFKLTNLNPSLTGSSSHTGKKCELVDNAQELIYKSRLKHSNDIKKQEELKILEGEELKSNQKI